MAPPQACEKHMQDRKDAPAKVTAKHKVWRSQQLLFTPITI